MHNHHIMEHKTILEILVDRQNEKWAGIFNQILVVLHNTIDTKKSLWKTSHKRPHFSFEIVKIWNKIRFFIVSEVEYMNFLKNQIYAHYPNVEMYESPDYLADIDSENISVGTVKLAKNPLYSIKTFSDIQETLTGSVIDPYSSLTAALLKTGNNTTNIFSVTFSPITDGWKKEAEELLKWDDVNIPGGLKKFFIASKKLKFLVLPFLWLVKGMAFFFRSTEDAEAPPEEKKEEIPENLKEKLSCLGYGVDIRLACLGTDVLTAKLNIKELYSPLSIFASFENNAFTLGNITSGGEQAHAIKERICTDSAILSSQELSGLVHFPTTYVQTPNINWVLARRFESPVNLPLIPDPEMENDLTPIGKTNFRGESQLFGIGPNDRRRHMYIIGKTGMGKSTLLENMIVDDIKKWRGVAVIDPHGDLAEAIIGNIPKSRTNQTIIFDPSDIDWPIAFNMLDDVPVDQRALVASGIVGIFKKIFGDSWWPRLEHILRNTVLALLEYPKTTLISIPLMLTSEVYRNKVVEKISDPVVKGFWLNEYAKMAPNQKVEAAAPILNKVGQFLSSTILRNILGQTKNTFNIRWAMDNKKIIIVNLSKWKIGEDASAFLGSMMVTKFQMDAMSRADMPERDRTDFYLYVDEFQNFATDSFATILSEARKYKLNLVMANQYIDQMQETVRGAVFGNVGSIVSFQVGYHDAMIMKEIFGENISTQDLTNLRKYSVYTKQLIDGMPSKLFSADTLAPYPIHAEEFRIRYQKILQVCRQKYSSHRKEIEEKIYKHVREVQEAEIQAGKKPKSPNSWPKPAGNTGGNQNGKQNAPNPGGNQNKNQQKKPTPKNSPNSKSQSSSDSQKQDKPAPKPDSAKSETPNLTSAPQKPASPQKKPLPEILRKHTSWDAYISKNPEDSEKWPHLTWQKEISQDNTPQVSGTWEWGNVESPEKPSV